MKPLSFSILSPHKSQVRKEVKPLNPKSLETTDIFRGAFFLCMGNDLKDIRFRDNGKRIISFLFTGAELNRLDKDYRDGQALVNPVQFRESLNHLRDIVFEKLHENKNGEMRYDRKRKDRKNKKER